ncbi:hypothetical protein EYF80_033750 [Liparis tanakae]|uniref:Uncharacterized protein n=1 Tax=Liparis tanakae TaxID=230148 RepID=A0A4Z2GTU6_9TELE|nr:hypothetical protein EYF80_033750 [Liparis tanakae]
MDNVELPDFRLQSNAVPNETDTVTRYTRSFAFLVTDPTSSGIGISRTYKVVSDPGNRFWQMTQREDDRFQRSRRKTRVTDVIRTNFVFALIYNLVGIAAGTRRPQWRSLNML